jgi:hypothetical protein
VTNRAAQLEANPSRQSLADADATPTGAAKLRPWQVLTIVVALAVGLAADVRTDVIGQALIGIVIWIVMFCFLARITVPERHAMMACLTIATAGELALSLGWGLYTYRLGNIAPFVPPGHVLLFMLGLWLASRITGHAARVVFVCAGLYSAGVALIGFDTFAAPLFLIIAIAWCALPAHRRLYAGTFTLSLVLEIYGTWLGVWSWALDVPGLPLATTNPPGTASAFYIALDALVVTAMMMILPPLKQRYGAVKAA